MDSSAARGMVRMDITFRSADGRTVAIAGDVPFRVIDDRELCGFQ